MQSPDRRQYLDIATELRLLVDGAVNYAIYMLDPHGRVAIWNQGAERIKGWREEEVVGRSADIFYVPEDVAAGKPKGDLDEARRLGRLEEESCRVRKDGSRFMAHVTIIALYAPNGQFWGFGKVVRDITEKHQAEKALAESEARLAAILRTVPDAIVMTDADDVICWFGVAAETMFQCTSQDMTGLPMSSLFEGAYRRLDVAETPPGRPFRRKGRRRNGQTFALEITIGDVLDAGEEFQIAVLHDVTERDRTEAKLHRLQSELLHSSRVSAMGTMAATLAHELHQPLTAIVNYVSAVGGALRSPGSIAADEMLVAIDETARQALRAGAIVRRLRDFVERGETDKSEFALKALIEEACSIVRIDKMSVEFDLNLDPQAEMVFADRIQAQQLLTNLLRNAIEAMADIRTRRIGIATIADGDQVRVTVIDSGPGFDPEIRDRMFDYFAGSKTDGMGVGLAICRTIVEAHGGRIWADRKTKGQGATIHFTLPLATNDRDDNA